MTTGRRLLVNGLVYPLADDIPDDVPLLWILREEIGLTGTKFGCGAALCGACTVHVAGEPKRSCVTPVGEVLERAILTIEGVHEDPAKAGASELTSEPNIEALVQRIWLAENVAQCGYCQPGQIMSASALLRHRRAPTDEDIDAVMSASLCRCGTYVRIRRAIHKASEELAKIAGSAPVSPAAEPPAPAPAPAPAAGKP
jgi:isoquinoline 1-oxidoreductase subunit alpha